MPLETTDESRVACRSGVGAMSRLSKVVLPSGRRVLLTKLADPKRPWELSGTDGAYVLTRPRRGDSSTEERYSADRTTPLLLDKADAEALVVALNANAATRFQRN